jgi:hypothetical protein
MEFDGAAAGIGGLQQLITALSYNAAPAQGSWAFTTNATTTAITYTPAMVLGGLLRRTGTSGGISDVLPNAGLITAAWPGVYPGATSPLLLCNLQNGTIILTQSADATTTLGGTTTVVTLGIRLYLLSVTTCPVNIIGLSYVNGVVTLTTNLPHGIAVGGNAITLNMSNAAFNGTFTVATVPNYNQLTFALATATAFATDPSTPNVSSQKPALLNTASAVLCTGCWAWPATNIA